MTAAVCSGAAAAELSLRSVTVTQRTAAKRLRTGSAGRDALKKNLFLFWGFFFSPHQKMPFQEWKVIPQNSAGRGCATCLQPPAFSHHPHGLGPPGGLQLLTNCRDVTWSDPQSSFLHAHTALCTPWHSHNSQSPKSALLHCSRESHAESREELLSKGKMVLCSWGWLCENSTNK